MRSRLPPSFVNPITMVGAAIAIVSFIVIVFLAVLEHFDPAGSPYMGILAFILVPSVLLTGLAIAVFGIWREHRRNRIGKPIDRHMPILDLNNPRHRTAVSLVSFGSLALILFSSFGSFKAYEAMESDKFCGTSCHVPMEPEYTAYSNSPHARVGCVKCHIGSGADWFVKSKLSGSYQLYAVLFNKFPRPIHTPIKNLRPAQETCEQCHWPKQFYSEKLISNTYFTSGEKTTKWTLDLLMRIGGGNAETGTASGIHWHMNIGNKVTYIAIDEGRQVIPWVRSEGLDGAVHVYRSTETPLTAADSASHAARRMDCIDCHNRPAHIYQPPARSVNHLMTLGWIDPSLPGAKDLSVFVLETPYSSTPVAVDSIRIAVKEFYAANFPALLTTKGQEIERMIAELQEVYRKNYFPAMHTSWKKSPDNIGHMYFLGCFRCHDGKHVAEDGKVLSKDCNVCHAILSQQFENASGRVALKGVKYQHPVDVGDAWETQNCNDCHNPPALPERAPGSQPGS
jgi:nitrate/TMAO reductase-like tetraheme cytochrome c subunit